MGKFSYRFKKFLNLTLWIFIWICAKTNLIFPDELYVLKYGESLYSSQLTNRKSKGKIRMDWLFYLYVKGDKVILIDSGTDDIRSIHKFSIDPFIKPDSLIKSLDILARDVTDIFITHSHFDHAGGIFLFPEANLHIHPLEYSKIKQSFNSQKYTSYFKMMESQKKVFQYSTYSEVFGFLRIIPTLGHTSGSLSFEINHGGSEIVFVGDECYYFEECSRGIGTFPKALYDVRMNKIYMDYLSKKDKKTTKIFPFHDPDVLRFFQMNEAGTIGRFLISTE